MTTIDPMRFVIPRQYSWQIRLHREQFTARDVLEDYINQSEIAFMFQHDADDEVSRTHCHTYLFNLKRQRSTIDGYLRKRFTAGNSDFAVSQTCGKKKRPIDVIGAWCYGTTSKLIDPVLTKGMSDSEVEYLRGEAREFWQKVEEAEKSRKSHVQIMEVIIEKEKKDNIWLDYKQ